MVAYSLPPSSQSHSHTMKCFHFSGGGGAAAAGEPAPRFPWARSLSMASSTGGTEPRRSTSGTGVSDGPVSSPPPPRRQVAGPPDGLRAFTLAELKAATRGFRRALMIGEGGFGCVFRGFLNLLDEEESDYRTVDVAVKQLNRNGLQGHKEWITEVNILVVAKHPNLVKLVGYCVEDDERGIQRLLVYEFMPNKSLEDQLLTRISLNLSWELRLRIARDAARGLTYLHEEMDYQLIFRDFKTSNILLDEDFNAKLSDFGFARHGPTAGVGHVSTSVVGTVGYAAPEYVHSGRLTAKSDVWSFGVVLYELITGRRSVNRNLPRGEQKLLDWAKPYATDPKKLHIIVDPRLQGQCSVKSIHRLAILANKCLSKQPKSRPKMSQVVEMLDQIIDMSNEESPGDIIEAPSISNDSAETKEIPKKTETSNSRVFEVMEMISLRNRSVGRLERLLVPGSVVKLARA